ncbi:DegT/DnrJ/EryC1/StrS family aminotransferase [bacterium]|nr:DegT/DnrJ/EryC1/StrS family aminotransferase [bacterium]
MNIPNLDLHAQHVNLKPELIAAFERVLQDSSFVLGKEVSAFETEFAQYLGVDNVIGVSSGTAALHIALQALGVGEGDEVIVPAMTFYATAEAVILAGGTPVFVDIDRSTWCIDPNQIEQAITSKTVGILPVHLLGLPADMEKIHGIAVNYNLWVLEDCAHSPGSTFHGKKTGALGNTAAFSLYPGKNLGALGEAGAIATNDNDVAERCRKYRDHGSTEKFVHDLIGQNARMDGLQAAFLRVKLPYLDNWNDARLKIAAIYREELSQFDLALQKIPDGYKSNYHVFAVTYEKRDELFASLKSNGVNANMHYPIPLHMHPGFEFLGYQSGNFPITESYASKTLSLPLFPEMNEEQVKYVVDSLRNF